MKKPQDVLLPVVREASGDSPEQSAVSRRTACQFMGGATGMLVLSGCGDGFSGGSVRPKFDMRPADMSLPDLSMPDLRTPDLAGADLRGADLTVQDLTAPPMDMATGCPATGINTLKRPSQFLINTATFFGAGALPSFYVCRDNAGLFAMTAICTHFGCQTQYPGTGMVITCFCHGSQFSLTGQVVRGPAGTPLNHYAICQSFQGHVVVVHTVVPAAQRY